MKSTAAEAILKIIEQQGVGVVFGYPGAANTPIYDSICHTGLRYILTRNEQGAAHAASSYFKMTGRVGVCLATSGPGATNLVTGIANAYMDSIPLVAITGQVDRSLVGKDAFQEVDVTGVTTPITKHNYLASNAEEVPRIISEAFYIAGTGRPGPVVVDVPMDVQLQLIDFEPPGKPEIRGYRPDIPVDQKQVRLLAKAIKKAKRPLIVAGGGVLTAGASAELARLCEQIGLPAVSTLMGVSALPSAHRQYLGMSGLHGNAAANAAFSRADLLIFAGARVSDRSVSDGRALSARATVAHIDIDPAEINKNVPSDISIAGNLRDVLALLTEYTTAISCAKEWLEEYAEFKRENIPEYRSGIGTVNPKYFLQRLSAAAGPDAVVATEVGQNQIWTANYYSFTRPNTFLTSGGFGTMGYGLPAAIGAKIARPELTVIAVEGDGSFQMSMPELGTMKQWGADLKIVVFVNRVLGMVREQQQLHFHSNFVSVDLGEYPRFDKIAAAYDIPYRSVSADSEVDAAICAMLETDGAFLLEVAVDKEESTL